MTDDRKEAVKKANWVADLRIEKEMNDDGFKYKVVKDVPLTDIDWGASRDNIARLSGDVNDDMVEDYCTAQKDGDPFPMSVLRHGVKGLIITSGVHRTLGTERAGFTHIDAYVAEFPDQLSTKAFSITANRITGTRIGKAEAVQFAVGFIVEYSASAAEVAKKLKLPKLTVVAALRVHRCRIKLSELRTRPESLNDTIISLLVSELRNENVLVAMAKAAHMGGVRTEDFKELRRKVNSQKTEKTKLSAIADWVKAWKDTAPARRGPITLEVRTKFLRALHTLYGVIEDKTRLGQVQIPSDSEEAKAEAKLWRAAKKVLDKMFSRSNPTAAKRRSRGTRK